MKRLLVVLLFLVAIGLIVYFFVAGRVFDQRINTFVQPPPYAVSADALAFHDSLFVADLHNDFLLWNRDLLRRHPYGHTDLPRLAEAKVALQIFSVVSKVPAGQNFERNEADARDNVTALVVGQRWPMRTWTSLRERALYQAEKLHEAAARSEGRLLIIRTRADLDAFIARRQNEPEVIGALLALEGVHPLESDFANLDVFFEAGYRMMGLTHFFDNEVAGSAHGTERGGLTDLGRRVVRRMEERGIVVDLAHVAPAAIDEVLAMATRPVVVSHTGVQGTCPGPRNLSDDHLRSIAAQGGVVGIGFWEGAVCESTVAAIVRAIRYVADLVGTAHVALGSDFDGTIRAPFDVTGLPLLTEALLEAGFTPAEIRLIMGENVVRLLRATLP